MAEFEALERVPVEAWAANGIEPVPAIVARAGGLKLGRARFAFEPALGRYFEFDAFGLPCHAVGAYEGDNLADIVAWPLDRPMQHARLARRAWSLGGDWALSANRFDPPTVHRHPLGWLQAGCRGLVILDAAVAREQMWHVGELRAEDDGHADELCRLMVPPKWRGKMMVPA